MSLFLWPWTFTFRPLTHALSHPPSISLCNHSQKDKKRFKPSTCESILVLSILSIHWRTATELWNAAMCRTVFPNLSLVLLSAPHDLRRSQITMLSVSAATCSRHSLNRVFRFRWRSGCWWRRVEKAKVFFERIKEARSKMDIIWLRMQNEVSAYIDAKSKVKMTHF